MSHGSTLPHTSLPLWQFIGLLVIFSILIGSPIFVCFVYHRRKERDRLEDVSRRACARRLRGEYVIAGADYYLVPFPRDISRAPVGNSRVTTPRREVSGSDVPLLVLKDSGGDGGDISRGRVRGRFDGEEREEEEGVMKNFAERAGTVSSPAYPRTVHGVGGNAGRARGRGNYGTLGYVMHSTYTAAQRAYRGRRNQMGRLNMGFWTGLVQQITPWGLKGGGVGGKLEAIDEESVGSSRFRGSSNVDIVSNSTGVLYKGPSGIAGSAGTLESESSGYMSKGTPPTFEKVDSREPYNPSLARSLTRRLLKFGFDQVRDGVISPHPQQKRNANGSEEDEDEEAGRGRQVSGVWKKGGELKKRALERKKLDGGGNRLFSFQKKKADDGDNDEGEEDDRGGDTEEIISQEDLAKTSIRDFAHAFNKDIVGGEEGDYDDDDGISPTGTIRIHHIDDEEDPQSIILPDEKEVTVNASSPSSAFENIDLDPSPASPNVTDTTKENVHTITTIDVSPSSITTQIEISTPPPAGATLRGRKTLRDRSSVPRSQRMRMTRNTPKNTLGRTSLQGTSSYASSSRSSRSVDSIEEYALHADDVAIIHGEIEEDLGVDAGEVALEGGTKQALGKDY
ncbi:hypothetical protein TWF481_005140 [Arthrobotrys musiformis]|uniref:Uncharacterized protein n=1 Tax=Arthrobotrys musiformis TaxID=47236 RepID=A0AAV9WCU0_9PEZI